MEFSQRDRAPLEPPMTRNQRVSYHSEANLRKEIKIAQNAEPVGFSDERSRITTCRRSRNHVRAHSCTGQVVSGRSHGSTCGSVTGSRRGTVFGSRSGSTSGRAGFTSGSLVGATEGSPLTTNALQRFGIVNSVRRAPSELRVTIIRTSYG